MAAAHVASPVHRRPPAEIRNAIQSVDRMCHPISHGSTKPKPRDTPAQWVTTPNTNAMAMATIVSTFDSASVEGSIPTPIRTVPVRVATPMAIRTTVPVAAISAVAVAPVSVR